MNQRNTCCHDLTRVRGGFASPFTRVITLDWYDGPRAGLVQFEACGREFRFEFLDERVDDGHGDDLRVFSLAPLPTGAIARVVDALAGTHTPRWPVWTPVWTFPDQAIQAAVEQTIDEVLEGAGSPELAVVTSDLSREIRDARTITAQDIAAVNDWLSFLANAPAASET